jgi:dual-specificity kinase
MSTPSTLNPTHHQYYSPHQIHHSVANYHSNGQMNGASRQTAAYYNGYAPNNTSDTSDLRRAATSNSTQRHSNQLPPIQASPPSNNNTYSTASEAMNRDKRKPDWNEFYKNGVPAEIIVIDDDTPPPTGQPRRTNGYSSQQHMDKKQRVGTAYDPVYNPQPSYSTTQTPYYENSASTDRTTSAYHTTAPTSLGSSAGNGTYLPPLEDGTVGQKRKRTRAQAAEDSGPAKRREVERLTPPHIHYIPPDKPIIKAKEVHVELIRDVCGCTPSRRRYCAHTKQKQNATERYDDEDGHYNVMAGASLTDRCR